MSGKLNKQEQVQVVIRLKPISEEQTHPSCVYVSDDQDKTLVVETPNKKQLFVFDNIANEDCTQLQLYEQIGKELLKSSTQGFNCCIFAYGQTGAGKSYSILGKPQELVTDIYCQSRGILPRLLSDLFSWYEEETDRAIVKCSYMEIYNQQIFDLLKYEQKNHQIREDLKRGVFVEGLFEEKVQTYDQAMTVLLKGVKNRKISQTSMNNESSRSHTIFTLNIQFQISEGQTLKYRKSKINIVDLAGSQRAKQTKVQGDRLKQGCNINKSLHVLGNVINALVESSKKKKHIPFRDSKLTHFLKDSLCGNSLTKLLANVHPSKSYLGDTLSTLMFAKRAKILKLKVQVNENVTQNFQELRKEIKKLRNELAEARYIKNEQKMTQRNVTQINETQSWEKIIDVSGFDNSKNQNALKVFEENETNYKALMDIYEEHMKICSHTSQIRKNGNFHKEWKNIQKKNQAYRNLIKNFPAFTKIFKENILLRNEIKEENKISFGKIEKDLSVFQDTPDPKRNFEKNEQKVIIKQSIDKDRVTKVVEHYQALLVDIQKKFTKYIKSLQGAYQQLDDENKAKDEKIKQLMRRKELPPDLEELRNENQYLKLNVLELEQEIEEMQSKITKYQIEVKELKKSGKSMIQIPSETFVTEEDCDHYVLKLTEIKSQLQSDMKIYEQEKAESQKYFTKMKDELLKFHEQNKTLKQESQVVGMRNKQLKRKMNELLKIENETEITKQNTNTFWTNEQSTEEFMQMELLCDKNADEKSKFLYMLEKGQSLRQKLEKQLTEQEDKTRQLSNQIVKLHKSYGNQIQDLKEQIRDSEKKRKQLTQENYINSNRIRQLEEMQQHKEKGLNHARSYKNLNRYKEPQMQFPPKLPDKNKKEKIDELRRKISTGDIKKTLKIRQESIETSKKKKL